MTLITRFVISVAMASLPLLAGAEGKCNDDPFPLENGKLAVVWTIPLPPNAPGDDSVVDRSPALMIQLDKLSPVEPADFPAEYATNVWSSSYPDDRRVTRKPEKLGTPDAHKTFLARFGLQQGPEAVPITDAYFKARRVLFGAVVEHPPVPKLPGYDLCTCILQRAVLLWDDQAKKEHLWVRSRFRSAKDARNWTNFEPEAPLEFVFPSQVIWFPLAYNHVLPESPAFLVLDVVTRKKIGTVPGFIREDLGQVTYQLSAKEESWYVVRLRARFQKGANPPDLTITPSR